MAATGIPSSSTARRLAQEARARSCARVGVYRPFFIFGIVTVLTAGCLLGALALYGLSVRGTYLASAWTPYVLAHANSQLYGWVGFFVMGFSLQLHAPVATRVRLFHGLAWSALGLMSVGIVLRFVAEPLAQSGSPAWVRLGVLSAWLQFIAVLLFVLNTALTRYRPRLSDGTNGLTLLTHRGRPDAKRPLTWPTLFVFFSLLCLLVVAAAEPFAFALSHQSDKTDSVLFVAEWFPPLRETQFLGFVGSMVFGVGLARFREVFGTVTARPGPGLAGFTLWTVGLVARDLGWLAYFRGGMQPGTGWLYFVGGAMLCSGAILVAGSAGIFEAFQGWLRTHKFLRTGFLWLLLAGLMMVVEPFYLRVLGQPFSHAYTGAVRHAVTVGFISQTIIAFSSTIVPNLAGLDQGLLPRLWPTFLLLNLGNAARVFLEVATDFSPWAFRPMGWTGFVELVGLALWAIPLLGLLVRSRAKAVALGT